MAQYQSTNITPVHRSKVAQILFMKIDLIIHQILNLIIDIQGLRKIFGKLKHHCIQTCDHCLKHLKAETEDDAETKFQEHDLLYNFYLDKSFIF